MIIRKPTAKDLPRLSGLWQEAFGDSQEDVENFYETAFSFDRALLAQEQNPVACIYWIDAQIADQKVAYLYAFAVDGVYRGQGVGKTLLKKALETLEGEGYAGAILVPGEESLQAYYEKAGFSVFGKGYSQGAAAPGLPVKKVDAKAYVAKRQTLHPALQWEERAFFYLERFCHLYAGEDWVLAVGREGVQEFVGKKEDLPHILYTLNIETTDKTAVAMAYCFENMTLPDTFGPAF